MWIDELERELTGRMLDIWRGHTDDGTRLDMPEHKRVAYISQWRRERGLVRPGQPVGPQPAKRCDCGKNPSGVPPVPR